MLQFYACIHKKEIIFNNKSILRSCTRDAGVTDVQVSLEFLETRTRRLELRIRDPDLTLSASGAARVRKQQDVRLTAHVTEILKDKKR